MNPKARENSWLIYLASVYLNGPLLAWDIFQGQFWKLQGSKSGKCLSKVLGSGLLIRKPRLGLTLGMGDSVGALQASMGATKNRPSPDFIFASVLWRRCYCAPILRWGSWGWGGPIHWNKIASLVKGNALFTNVYAARSHNATIFPDSPIHIPIFLEGNK